jgi:acetyltransferase-like isoleucine patch superfamily enzyme
VSGVSAELFAAAVARLAELRANGLVRVKQAPGNRGIGLVIDSRAENLPPRRDGLYTEITDVLSAISWDMPIDKFIEIHTASLADLDQHDEEEARAKYQAAQAAFPAHTLRGGISVRARRRLRRLIVSGIIILARRTGRLHRMMGRYRFARLLGADGRRTAWQMLGAQIDDTAFISARVSMNRPQRVAIGAGSWLGGRIVIESYGKVSIGRNVMMNHGIQLYSTQHDIDDPGFRGERRTISIGDYAWLPRRIIVLPGVRIGSHAVIGTGSVVSRDVPDYGVAIGNPARVVRERARVRYTYVPIFVDRPAVS